MSTQYNKSELNKTINDTELKLIELFKQLNQQQKTDVLRVIKALSKNK